MVKRCLYTGDKLVSNPRNGTWEIQFTGWPSIRSKPWSPKEASFNELGWVTCLCHHHLKTWIPISEGQRKSSEGQRSQQLCFPHVPEEAGTKRLTWCVVEICGVLTFCSASSHTGDLTSQKVAMLVCEIKHSLQVDTWHFYRSDCGWSYMSLRQQINTLNCAFHAYLTWYGMPPTDTFLIGASLGL